jgi:hypothetical protein
MTDTTTSEPKLVFARRDLVAKRLCTRTRPCRCRQQRTTWAVASDQAPGKRRGKHQHKRNRQRIKRRVEQSFAHETSPSGGCPAHVAGSLGHNARLELYLVPGEHNGTKK